MLGVQGYNKLTNKAYEEMKRSILYSLLEKFVKFFKILAIMKRVNKKSYHRFV